MPESQEIAQLLSGSYIHYFHCLQIVDLLKGTEASTKNIFGRYSSQRMKDWQEIVSLYEKDSTYLVEISSLLVRNVSYEIPSLKKQIAKCQQLQQEYSHKEEECQLGAVEMKERFYNSCKQYGITGHSVRRELLALVKELPSLLTETGAKVESLWEAIELYQACVGFVCESPTEQVVPMLRHVQKRGNTTVYEWRTGTEPTEVERPSLEEPPEQVADDAIDWGNFGIESTSEGIKYGISAETDEIDWGISLEPDSKEAGNEGINWGDGDADPLQITVVEAGTEAPEGVARGPDALTLLEYPETRNQFIDELMELEIFLSQRALEMSEEADILSVSQFQLAPPILQGQTKAQMVAMVSTLQDLIGQLTSLRMQHLFMILASPRSGFPLEWWLLWVTVWSGASSQAPSSTAALPYLFLIPYYISLFPDFPHCLLVLSGFSEVWMGVPCTICLCRVFPQGPEQGSSFLGEEEFQSLGSGAKILVIPGCCPASTVRS
ncbi:CDK5 regulatory subunit-associated protein 3 isoform X3 [Gracilinanus agilis]|nr:CDK5 regulatory subunit-associated protein 3 isoform X3 [Gracilinanus agilis]